MIKYILLAYLCSPVAGKCLPVIPPIKEFSNFKSCAIYGYHFAGLYLSKINSSDVNNYKMYVSFLCNQSKAT